ncbi:MAG: hypothetical protein KUG81_02785 [Gammaproteobacteria bacterium]|nr:hypothetical protein [Gammaproteobacteria bacterium]
MNTLPSLKDLNASITLDMIFNQKEAEVTSLSGAHEEVAKLRAMAKDKLDWFAVAREYINRNLQNFKQIVPGDYVVQYNDRDELVEKTQSKSQALWVVVLMHTIRNGYVNKAGLSTALINWCQEELNIWWSKESAGKIAMVYINELVNMHIINKDMQVMSYTENGQDIDSRAALITTGFAKERDALLKDMWRTAPMVSKPMEFQPYDWKDTNNGIGKDSNIRLIKSKCYKGTKVDRRVLDAVNRLQSTKFTTSPAIIEVCYDYIDNEAFYAPQQGALSNEEFARVAKQHKDHVALCHELTEYEGKEFFFPITMDKRGRMYYRGGLCTPQGTDLCKAAFQFADKQPLGNDGERAISIHAANVLGQNGLSINDRVNWVDKNYELINNIADLEGIEENFPGADKHQALVAAKELQALWTHSAEYKTSTMFKSGLVCHQDGTCNGLQHMAALTNNRQTAITVNCTTSTADDEPQDIYGIIADYAVALSSGTVKDLIRTYGRSMAKKPVMITGYGAGEATIATGIAEFLSDEGEGVRYAADIADAYCRAIEANAGAVNTFTNAIKLMVKKAIKSGNTLGGIQWTTADGFLAQTEYLDDESHCVRGKNYNAKCEGLGEVTEDEVRTAGALAPNFVHSIDATHLRMVVNDCPFDMVTVHDSIGTHACDYFETADSIRKKFVEVHEYNAMQNLCSSLDQRTPKFRGDYQASEALESTYIFS